LLVQKLVVEKIGLKSSRKNSVKRATLSQCYPIWHSGNVTTAIYRPMSLLTGRVDFGWRKSVLSATHLFRFAGQIPGSNRAPG
jgi:hypothetical protein